MVAHEVIVFKKIYDRFQVIRRRDDDGKGDFLVVVLFINLSEPFKVPPQTFELLFPAC